MSARSKEGEPGEQPEVYEFGPAARARPGPAAPTQPSLVRRLEAMRDSELTETSDPDADRVQERFRAPAVHWSYLMPRPARPHLSRRAAVVSLMLLNLHQSFFASPFAFRLGGLYVVLVVFFGIILISTGMHLVDCIEFARDELHQEIVAFHTVGQVCAGRPGSILAGGAQLLSTLATAVAQKDILDASVTALLGWGEPWATDVHSLRNAWVACATAALCLPPVLLSDGGFSPWFACLGVAAVILVIMVLFILLCYVTMHDCTTLAVLPFWCSKLKWTFFPASFHEANVCAGIAAFSWVGFSSIPVVYRDMRHVDEFERALPVAQVNVIILQIFTAVTGFLVFGHETAQLIQWNLVLWPEASLRWCGYMVLVLTVVASYCTVIPFILSTADELPLPRALARLLVVVAVGVVACATEYKDAAANLFAIIGALTLVNSVTVPLLLYHMVVWKESSWKERLRPKAIWAYTLIVLSTVGTVLICVSAFAVNLREPLHSLSAESATGVTVHHSE